MGLIPPRFLNAVVALGFRNGGQTTWAATGFFYGRRSSGIGLPGDGFRVYLITNRHVVEGLAKQVRVMLVRCNPEANTAAKEYDVDLFKADGTPGWYSHPNPAVDVVAIPVNMAFLQEEKMEVFFFENDAHAAATSKMKEIGVMEGDGVFILGFPTALVGPGHVRNTVVVRAGVAARLRDTLEKPQAEFLVDCKVFPGNSGGPVLLRPEALAINGTKAQERSWLVGIVRGYVSYRDVAVSKQTGRERVTFEENSGLSQVHSVDCIDEATDLHIRELRASAKATNPLPTLTPTSTM